MGIGSKSTGALAKPGGKKGKVTRVVDRYEELKTTVTGFLQDRFKVAAALKKIHDDKLYKKDYDTFENFCHDELGISRGYAYKLLEAGEPDQKQEARKRRIALSFAPAETRPA